MNDAFDLYSDLDFESAVDMSTSVGTAASASSAEYVVPPWRREGAPVVQGANPATQDRPEDKDDGEAVRALWERLMSAEGLTNLEDDDLDSTELPSQTEGAGNISEDVRVLFCEAEEETSSKRPRLEEAASKQLKCDKDVTTPVEGSNEDGDDDAFDFEADLPAASSCELKTFHSKAGAPARCHDSSQRLASTNNYFYNAKTQRYERWESGLAGPRQQFSGPHTTGKGRGKHLYSGLQRVRKTRLCRLHQAGHCKWGDQCWDAHGEDEVRTLDAEALRNRFMAQSAWQAQREAQLDVKEYSCALPQALVVRLALRLEQTPNVILPCMEKAGLPAAEDRRTTVRALLRLCHPDKCSHPEAKRAVQIIGPLLVKTF
eukprot:TRINITY_DN53360_c0_g1_i1.p1 TRINITY_DN53360_c0_g1~~TRINITY_DN53360_c0_g1_i1.p1  ORF type:complete len:374 (+),score=65.51 TRINITY_DN53360_c0_g1_i1:105-1226(+)